MLVTLYMDMPSENAIQDILFACARPAYALTAGWTRWRIDLDTDTGEAKMQVAPEEERGKFPPLR